MHHCRGQRGSHQPMTIQNAQQIAQKRRADSSQLCTPPPRPNLPPRPPLTLRAHPDAGFPPRSAAPAPQGRPTAPSQSEQIREETLGHPPACQRAHARLRPPRNAPTPCTRPCGPRAPGPQARAGGLGPLYTNFPPPPARPARLAGRALDRAAPPRKVEPGARRTPSHPPGPGRPCGAAESLNP